MLLALAMALSLAACGGDSTVSNPPAGNNPTESNDGSAAPADDPMAGLIAAAQAEGELVVYGSCEEEYLAAACENFETLYGIKVQYQRRWTGQD